MSMYLRSFTDFLAKKVRDAEAKEDNVFGVFFTENEIITMLYEGLREYEDDERD